MLQQMTTFAVRDICITGPVQDYPVCKRQWIAAVLTGGPVEFQSAPEPLTAAPVERDISF